MGALRFQCCLTSAGNGLLQHIFMVEVFKTNVPNQQAARQLLAAFGQQLPGSKINFDLEDCDRILRVEGETVNGSQVIELVEASGFQCMVLE